MKKSCIALSILLRIPPSLSVSLVLSSPTLVLPPLVFPPPVVFSSAPPGVVELDEKPVHLLYYINHNLYKQNQSHIEDLNLHLNIRGGKESDEIDKMSFKYLDEPML